MGSKSFPKKEKLKSKPLFDALFEQGRSLTSFPIRLVYLETELPKNVRIQAGVAVPKKSFASSVKRNRIKRLLREAYRLHKAHVFNNSQGNYAFLFLYLGKEMPTFSEVDRAMEKIMTKLLEIIDKSGSTGTQIPKTTRKSR